VARRRNNVLELARLTAVVAGECDNIMHAPKSHDESSVERANFTRDLQIARAHLDTAMLWLYKASGITVTELKGGTEKWPG